MSERGRLISRGEAADICRLVYERRGDALNAANWLEDGYSLHQVEAALGEQGFTELRTLPRRGSMPWREMPKSTTRISSIGA